MRKQHPDHCLPPLSTRMIFLHHRVRLHDSAVRHLRSPETAAPVPFLAWGLLLLLAAAILLGALHA
jgi:hypothetical protein